MVVALCIDDGLTNWNRSRQARPWRCPGRSDASLRAARTSARRRCKSLSGSALAQRVDRFVVANEFDAPALCLVQLQRIAARGRAATASTAARSGSASAPPHQLADRSCIWRRRPSCDRVRLNSMMASSSRSGRSMAGSRSSGSSTNAWPSAAARALAASAASCSGACRRRSSAIAAHRRRRDRGDGSGAAAEGWTGSL